MDPENPEKKTASGPNIPQVEEDIIRFWEENHIFEKSLEKTKDGKPYTFYDGPPFATGLPHYGHILASTIKDLVPRYQTMRGRFVRRRWGWDCHGLPIEALVEKKLNISGKKQIEEIGIKTFNETCRSMVLQYVEEWGKMVRRMGRWVDFENSYKTMDRDYMESVWWAFKQVHDKGLAYEGRKVLLYCPRCETPISNFEVAMDNSYQDVTEESVYVKFKVKGEENTYLLAWTTTPWTLPGNVALAVGKDIDYVKTKVGAETFVVAKVLANKVLPAGYAILSEMKGKKLVGLVYEPLYRVNEVVASDKAHKVYAADFVTTEDGTGIVHTAVVYGEDDYQLGLREGLPVVPLLDEKGHFNDKTPELIRGKYFKQSEKIVKDDLESRGLLSKRENYTHPYPHCWRCNTALYYTAIPAWFINVQKIKPKLLKTNEKQISWFPEHLKHGRYQKSVEAAPDWNISRNRYWGNPIPTWKCEQCGKNAVAGSLEDLAARAPATKNKYILLRHGESDNNTANICSTHFDTQKKYHLTTNGKTQSEDVAKTLKKAGIDLIYTSDYERARETADIVAKKLGVTDMREDQLIREINVGDFNEKPVKKYVNYFSNQKDKFTKAPPNGETMTDVMARAWNFLQKVEKEHEGKTILVVSHEDTLWAMQGVMSGWDVAQMAVAKVHDDDGGFMPNAEVRKVSLLNLPRNEYGFVDLHRPYIDGVVLKCDCGGAMHRTPEIFDSWVEAGSMPFAEYHYPFENKKLFESRFPAQFVAEYIAQTRAWFYVMHVMSQIVFGEAPFENVVTTGTILAEDGSKMSKSKNNYPDPWEVINKYGVDTLRFYLMSSVVMQADNLNFNMKDLENVYRKVVLILWNVQQYFLTYAPQGVSAEVRAGDGHVLDRWILARTKELVAATTEAFDGYDTVRATRAMAEFIDDLSTWYLRRSRGREDAGFFPTFRKVLLTTAQVIAPVMPHVAEAIYRELRAASDPESVHLSDWPEKGKLTKEELKLLEDMRVVREAASVGSAVRKSENVPVRQPIPQVGIIVADNRDISSDLLDVLRNELNAKSSVMGKISGGDVKTATGATGTTVVMNLELTNDLKLEGEIRKLERAIQEKRKELGMKVGEMARLTYFADDSATEAAFKGVDIKKTYVNESKKGAGGASGSFKLEKA